MAMFDVPVVVAFKAKEGTAASTFKLVMCPQNCLLSELKRNVMESFADFIPPGLRGRLKLADSWIKLEYKDAEGYDVDSDEALQRAIIELSEGGFKVPKLWLSCIEGEKPPGPGDGSGYVPSPSFYQKESGAEVSRASGSGSWVKDKQTATETGSDKLVTTGFRPSSASAAAKPHPPGKFKTVPCVHFQRGSCRHGAACTFIHEGQEVYGSSSGWGAPVPVQDPWKLPGPERIITSSSSPVVLPPSSHRSQQDEFVETYRGGGSSSWLQDKLDVGLDKHATLLSTPPIVKRPVPGGNYRTVPCKHFQRGHCRNGDDCTFLHASTNLPRVDDREMHRGVLSAGRPPDAIQKLTLEGHNSLSETQLCYWLQQKIEQPIGITIGELTPQSSTADFRKLVALLQEKNLTGAVMDKLVELLIKEEFRNSEMRDSINRIYSLLLGTPFMVRFHAHIVSLVQPKTRQIHPYVKLVEELQNRTQDGWKEVPLDAIKRVVSDEMTPDEESDAGFTAWRELLLSVNTLLDQRITLKRLYSTANRC